MMVTLVYARPYAAERDMLKGEFFTLSMFVAARHPGDARRPTTSSSSTSAWS